MHSNAQIILNVVCFQLLWWACVLSPLYGLSAAVFALCMLFSMVHLQWVEGWSQALPIVLTALLGCLFDQLGYFIGMVDFNHHPQWVSYIPLWMVALWLAFACTVNVSLRWLAGNLPLAFVLGAVFGPLAYWGAAKLGAVALPGQMLSLVWLGLGWGLLLPLMLRIRTIYLNAGSQ